MTTTNNKRDFSKGKIYKIEPMCEYEEGDIYIGSTTQDLLCKRFRNHRSDYGRYKNGKRTKTTSYDLFDKYGVDNCKMILIENVNASNYDELVSREAYYIRTLKCVNKYIPLRTNAEYYIDTKEKYKDYKQQYRDNHKEQTKEYLQIYNVVNREKILEQRREYYQDNKEDLLNGKKEYYKANIERIKLYNKQYYERKKQEKLERLNNTIVVNL